MMRASVALVALVGSLASAGAPPGPETVYNDAGYISVPRGELFYWFFESRNDPSTDPLMVWLSGGPGCSSLLALFEENGPYQIGDDGEPVLNPYSWNANASVIWLEQPLGTGFSTGVPVHNEMQVGDDVVAFLQGFFNKYDDKRYQDLDFYVFGESYAGHYVFAVSAAILKSNANVSNAKINLVGTAVGNGLTVPEIQYTSYLPFAQEHDLLSEPLYKEMAAVEQLCEPLIAKCNANNATITSEAQWAECLNAFIACNLGEVTPVQLSGINVYDVRLPCGKDPLCYDFSAVDTYLNRPDVQAELGANKSRWVECNHVVDLVLVYAGDWMKSFAADVTTTLEAGIKVLIYAGEFDFICNWMGNQAWTHQLDWAHADDFNAAVNTTFKLDDNDQDSLVVGTYVSAHNFTFLKVKDAGHLAPHDQPETTLAMVRRFIFGTW